MASNDFCTLQELLDYVTELLQQIDELKKRIELLEQINNSKK